MFTAFLLCNRMDEAYSGRARRRRRGKQVMLLQELDQVAIEQPGLLDLAGVAGAVEDFHVAAGNARLKRCGARMRAVLAAGEDDRRASDACMRIARLRFVQS